MKRARVAIVKGRDPSRMVKKALDLLDLGEIIREKDTVMVKPNYVFAKPPSSGMTTDPRVVESLIEFAEGYGAEVSVGEGGAGDTERAFDVVGIRDVVARHGVGLVNLNKDSRIKASILDGMALKEVGLAVSAMRTSCIINVPKLKVHSMAYVTLSMKNLMGFIQPKSIMHTRINEKIVDLAGLFKDKVKLNVVDGLIGGEVSESHGSPVRMGLVIAGRDMVAVDTVGTLVMGIDPDQVGYLSLAEKKGLGISSLADIEVMGKSIEDVKKAFLRPMRFRKLSRF